MLSIVKQLFKMHRAWFLFALVLILSKCEKETPIPAESADILEKLRALPGVEVAEIEPLYGYPRAFRIDLLQPVNHEDPNSPMFTQRIYLSHVDESLPMVFGPSGYGSSPGSVQEIAGIFQTNHLSVVHRYFIDAQPDPIDWQFLTIRQAAEDHHRIVSLLKLYYNNVWISSGVSKGGLTCLFHKRFFPDDVDATIAYVAPIEFGTSDTRFATYLATIGSEECRTSIHNFQRRCLTERDSLLPRVLQWFADHKYTISGNPDYALESGIKSYDWNFWQYHSFDCNDIPPPEASYEEMADHLIEASKMYRSSDELTEYYKPYVYQAYTEIGYPARDYSHINDLLKYHPVDSDEEAENPYGRPLVYNPSTILDIHKWLVTEGNNIIYLYGSIDPWSGGQIELTGQTNALKIMQEGGDHRIRIADLDERELVVQTLISWLDITIPYTTKSKVYIGIPREISVFETDKSLSINY